MLKKVRGFVLAVLVTAFYWTYTRLLFFRHHRRPKLAAPAVFAHWHGDELLLIGAFIRSRMAIMASKSKDGEMLKYMLSWLGYHVVRGSSSRGGAAGLKGLIDAVAKGGWNASLAVDGPRGPIYEVKPGILKLAQETGALLVPGASAASRRFIFKKAWNRCYLPFPFSRCAIVYGKPMKVPKGISAEEFESLRQQLQNELLALKSEAEAMFSREADLRKLTAIQSGV